MKISIKQKLIENNMSRYELAKKMGVTYPTIDKIYKEESTSIKFEILESICVILNCTPNDILIMEPETNTRKLAKELLIKNGIGLNDSEMLEDIIKKLDKQYKK